VPEYVVGEQDEFNLMDSVTVMGEPALVEMPPEVEHMETALAGLADYMLGRVTEVPGGVEKLMRDFYDKINIALNAEVLRVLSRLGQRHRIQEKAEAFLNSEAELDFAIQRGDRETAGRILDMQKSQINQDRTFARQVANSTRDSYVKPKDTEAQVLYNKLAACSPERLRQIAAMLEDGGAADVEA